MADMAKQGNATRTGFGIKQSRFLFNLPQKNSADSFCLSSGANIDLVNRSIFYPIDRLAATRTFIHADYDRHHGTSIIRYSATRNFVSNAVYFDNIDFNYIWLAFVVVDLAI